MNQAAKFNNNQNKLLNIFGERTPFSFLCASSLTPLLNPCYVHDHKNLNFNYDQKVLIQQTLQKEDKCVYNQECKWNKNTREYYELKQNRDLKDVLESFILNPSHEEFICIKIKDNLSVTLCLKEDQGETYYGILKKKYKCNFMDVLSNLCQSYFDFKMDMKNNEMIEQTLFRTQDINFSWSHLKNDHTMDYWNLCLLTGNVIRIPVRHQNCKHFEAFDLISLIEYIIGSGEQTFGCHICKTEYSCELENLKQFYIDLNYADILAKTDIFQPKFRISSQNYQIEIINYYKIDDQRLSIYQEIINAFQWKNQISENSETNDDKLQKLYQNISKQSLDIHFRSSSSQKQIDYMPVPVRCVNCFNEGQLKYYCDLKDFVINKTCFACGNIFNDLQNVIVFDKFLHQSLIKFAPLKYSNFKVVFDETEKDQFAFNSNDLLNLKMFDVYLSHFNSDMTLGDYFTWIDCDHSSQEELTQLKSFKDIPRRCKSCNGQDRYKSILDLRRAIKKADSNEKILDFYQYNKHQSNQIQEIPINLNPIKINPFRNNPLLQFPPPALNKVDQVEEESNSNLSNSNQRQSNHSQNSFQVDSEENNENNQIVFSLDFIE